MTDEERSFGHQGVTFRVLRVPYKAGKRVRRAFLRAQGSIDPNIRAIADEAERNTAMALSALALVDNDEIEDVVFAHTEWEKVPGTPAGWFKVAGNEDEVFGGNHLMAITVLSMAFEIAFGDFLGELQQGLPQPAPVSNQSEPSTSTTGQRPSRSSTGSRQRT